MSLFLRRYPVLVFLILVSLLQVETSHGGEQHQPSPVKLKVVCLPYLSYAPIFIAEAEGYFAKQGLEVEFIKMNKTATAVSALIQGKLDVSPGTIWPSQLNAIAHGARIKFVASRNYVAATGRPYAAIIARKDLVKGGQLDSPAQLRGLRISVNPSSYMGYFVAKLLEKAGMTLDDVKTVDLTAPVELEAFRQSTIDIAFAAEPWVTRIVKEGYAVFWMPAGKAIPGFQWGFILYGPTLLDKNPDAGRRFMVAYLKAVQQYNQGKTERNLEILAKYTGLDQQLLKQACWPTLRNDGRINFKSVLDFQEWAIKKDLIDSKVTEEQFWDSSFIEHACQILNIPIDDSD